MDSQPLSFGDLNRLTALRIRIAQRNSRVLTTGREPLTALANRSFPVDPDFSLFGDIQQDARVEAERDDLTAWLKKLRGHNEG